MEFFERCDREWRAGPDAIDVGLLETVQDVCNAYVANLRAQKGDEPANAIDQRFKALIYDMPFGKISLKKLHAMQVERWRNGLVTARRKKNSVNRIFRQFAAAMNYAKNRGLIESDVPWKSVGQFPVKDGRRNAYLTLVQRQALLTACDASKDPMELAGDTRELSFCTRDLGDLLRGLMFTGARLIELVRARVRDFNPRTGVLRLISAKNKKGEARPREFYLFEPAALEYFKRMTGDKPPDAYLVTRADGSAWVDEDGKPRRHQWGRGIRAAIRLANRELNPEDQIPPDTVVYTARHTVITDMLSEDGVESVAVEEVLGTSAAMIKQNYYKVMRERLQAKLAKRRSF